MPTEIVLCRQVQDHLINQHPYLEILHNHWHCVWPKNIINSCLTLHGCGNCAAHVVHHRDQVWSYVLDSFPVEPRLLPKTNRMTIANRASDGSLEEGYNIWVILGQQACPRSAWVHVVQPQPIDA
jgi:hypothetical protein